MFNYVDLYGLGHDFPGMPLTDNMSGLEKATHIEEEISLDIFAIIPDLRPDIRLIPYLQVHEYEGLLFSDTDAFAKALGRKTICPQLKSIRDSVASPEDINDNPNTAPSKRVLDVYPSYKKVIEGTVAAQVIGLETMRSECLHFNSWISRLESLTPLA